MKDPRHYLAQALATHPADPAAEAVRLVLVDAERYRHLLVRAALNAKSAPAVVEAEPVKNPA